MIIYEPPTPVEGAPNLTKGRSVFDVTYNENGDQLFKCPYPRNKDMVISALSKVHDPKYVKSIFNGVCPNGYGVNNQKMNDHSAHSCLILRDAARSVRYAASINAPIFAPVSGFHHSGYAYGGGYCTFNGLVLAADAFRYVHGHSTNVLIIDGDGHFGDGTADLIAHGSRDWLTQCSLDKSSVGGDALRSLRLAREALAAKNWDLVLYQAGADSHIDDPYMSGYLNDEEWKARDEIVFGHCAKNRIPCVFNLAGGYNGSKTILLHTSTVTTARQVYGEPKRARL